MNGIKSQYFDIRTTQWDDVPAVLATYDGTGRPIASGETEHLRRTMKEIAAAPHVIFVRAE